MEIWSEHGEKKWEIGNREVEVDRLLPDEDECGGLNAVDLEADTPWNRSKLGRRGTSR